MRDLSKINPPPFSLSTNGKKGKFDFPAIS
jgi:hypothetical protein